METKIIQWYPVGHEKYNPVNSIDKYQLEIQHWNSKIAKRLSHLDLNQYILFKPPMQIGTINPGDFIVLIEGHLPIILSPQKLSSFARTIFSPLDDEAFNMLYEMAYSEGALTWFEFEKRAS